MLSKSGKRGLSRAPKEPTWKKHVHLEHIKGVLASDLSGVEFAVYIYGLLRSNKNGEFFCVLGDVGTCTGHDRKRISEANTSLRARGLFIHTGRYHARKYPIFCVPMPKKGSWPPIPLALREKIHMLSSGALRLLVLLIVKGGWFNPFGCVVPYKSATKLAAEAGISEATANTAIWELKEHGWIVYELPHGQLAEVFALRGWRALITVTQKAGFVVPPAVPMRLRVQFLITLGTARVYPNFDWRLVRGALLQSAPKARKGGARVTPKKRKGALQKRGMVNRISLRK
jgi:hypothetical protein